MNTASETLLQSDPEEPAQSTQPSKVRWVRRVFVAVGACSLLVTVGFGLLALADFASAGNGSRDPRTRAEWVLARGDHLHYAFHIVAGRILDLCPCSRRAAGGQYYRAHFHAVTQTQAAVAANTHPRTQAEWTSYVFGPAAVSLDWLRDGLAWLGGRRPVLEVMVDLDGFTVEPSEIHIARGTSVTWRNVDELAEAHTVTADPGQAATFGSDFLEVGESYSTVFTERGRYRYYCTLHGEPGLKGMSGLVVVE